MKIAPIHATVLLLAALSLAGCKGEDPQAAARAAAEQAAAKEQAAEAMAKQFDAAVTAQNWVLAKGHGDILQIEHPASAAAARLAGSPVVMSLNNLADDAKQVAYWYT